MASASGEADQSDLEWCEHQVDAVEVPTTEYTLPKTATTLVSPEGITVILLGTAHISRKSVEEAQEIVKHIQPRLVFVELCKSRQGLLSLPLDDVAPHQELSIAAVNNAIHNGNGVSDVIQLVLSHFTFQMAEKIGLEITPGTEFAAAFQEAVKYGGKVALGDRDVAITLNRAWRALSLWEKLKLAWGLLCDSYDEFTAEDLERMKNSDIITEMMQELAEEFPRLMDPLIYERDRFLTYQLRTCCTSMAQYLRQTLQRCPEARQHLLGRGSTTIVAVVGMGHVDGIKKQWNKEVDVEDWERIKLIPPKPLGEIMLKYTTIAATVGIIGFIVYRRVARWR
eukprot:m.187570 g.187570  ORF g.187570 m.187570 type:complete len:339 (+) comp18506_c0_seq8:291-1307(+)